MNHRESNRRVVATTHVSANSSKAKGNTTQADKKTGSIREAATMVLLGAAAGGRRREGPGVRHRGGAHGKSDSGTRITLAAGNYEALKGADPL